MDCNERHLGCHAECKRYAEAIETQRKAKEKERELKLIYGDEVERSRRKYKNVR